MFCPECGKALAPVAPVAADATPEAVAETSESTGRTGLSGATAADRSDPSASMPIESPVAPVQVNPDPPLNQSPTGQAIEIESKTGGARERTRERLHRAGSAASSVARGALEDNVKRVEKIHHVSTAMFEEATYDPSLRFVLVALGLFLVFIILLVLSKVMG
jgi:hypothetical protein